MFVFVELRFPYGRLRYFDSEGCRGREATQFAFLLILWLLHCEIVFSFSFFFFVVLYTKASGGRIVLRVHGHEDGQFEASYVGISL